jgi:hypothetical protein
LPGDLDHPAAQTRRPRESTDAADGDHTYAWRRLHVKEFKRLISLATGSTPFAPSAVVLDRGTDWLHGSGPEASGPMVALILAWSGMLLLMVGLS